MGRSGREEIKMKTKCSVVESCDAPLCPLKKDTQNGIVWFSDEKICGNREFLKLLWVKQQKKIARKCKDKNTYFTFAMLNKNYIVKSGITGLNPDKISLKTEAKEVEKWLESHPEKKEISEEEKDIFRKRFEETKKSNSEKF